MKIMVIGGGAREHALVWKLNQSPQVERIWCLPGNAGISGSAECLPGNLEKLAELADTAQHLGVDLTIVGPELPLVLGIQNEFERRGLAILGPSRAASQLEGSKVFAKDFMTRRSIPTAAVYGSFDSAADAYTTLCEVDWPVVIKADGLCAGKGVLVTSSPDEATSFIERLMEKREFGDAGRRVIIEEGLSGAELSYIVLTDGQTFLPMAPTRDYKRAFDGDAGPNTGGMGAVSTATLLPPGLEEQIQTTIVKPTLAGMAKEGHDYKGFLYFGLMLTKAGPKVLEFNCRLGDPETQALVMRMDFDLAAACSAATSGGLADFHVAWSPSVSVCVVLATDGYPGKPLTGMAIAGIEGAGQGSEVAVFHGSTNVDGTTYYVSSGRVLTVAAGAETPAKARSLAYGAVERISFKGMHYRKDIGAEAASAKGSV